MSRKAAARRPIRLLEVILVIVILTILTAVLMPTLSRSRELARRAMFQSPSSPVRAGEPYMDGWVDDSGSVRTGRGPSRPLAHVKRFTVTIGLTPKRSVGTARPEPIYEAAFTAEIEAVNPAAARQECELVMPLPPEIISLADLEITVNSEPSEDVSVRDGVLVWHGRLDESKPTPIKVAYTAVGKGIYTLHTPPGKIVDRFEATMTVHKSDLRMMSLSLQPTSLKREANKTLYEWSYKRLMFGRPIVLDVLDVAPRRDELAELVWLGPVSVVVFGVLVSLLVAAKAPTKLEKWMLLLMVGALAGSYPLMYFAQDFMAAPTAAIVAAAAMVVVIAVRAATLFGPRLGLAGVAPLAAGIAALTLWAALEPARQGVVLTIEAVAAFVLAMLLLPKAQKAVADARSAPSSEGPAAGEPTGEEVAVEESPETQSPDA